MTQEPQEDQYQPANAILDQGIHPTLEGHRRIAPHRQFLPGQDQLRVCLPHLQRPFRPEARHVTALAETVCRGRKPQDRKD